MRANESSIRRSVALFSALFRRTLPGRAWLAVSLVSSASALAEPVVRLDIPYDVVPGVDPAQLRLDVYGDSTWTDRPIVVYVHGGCWQNGDKSGVGIKDEAFLDAGYVFVSTNYRLAPSNAYPGNARDVAAAVAWVHQNAALIGGNSRRIVLMGHSAGAHLVALVATDPRYLAEAGVRREDLEAVIALDTAAHDLAFFAGADGVLSGCHGDTFGQDPVIWAEASPITYADDPGPTPPFALPYSRGNNPEVIDAHRIAQHQNMAAALESAGVRADLIDGTYTTHGGINQMFGTPGDPVTEACFEFLVEVAPGCVRNPCPGDADNSGSVNFGDMTSVLGAFGGSGTAAYDSGDANCDGVVNFNDVTSVLANWGRVCP